MGQPTLAVHAILVCLSSQMSSVPLEPWSVSVLARLLGGPHSDPSPDECQVHRSEGVPVTLLIEFGRVGFALKIASRGVHQLMHGWTPLNST